MDEFEIKKLRNKLIKQNHNVSILEYTTGNYDGSGNFISEKIPTLTTDFCEIGTHNGNTYFVFIIESKYIDENLVKQLIQYKNINIYGIKNFRENIYPKENFNIKGFIEGSKKEPHIQIQFNYENLDARDLLNKYQEAINMFKENNILVFNQLEQDIRKLI